MKGKEVKEYDKTLDSEKCERGIAEWIGQPRKSPLSNEDKEAEGKEEYVGSTQSSTEDKSHFDEYEERCEYDQ